MTLSLWDFFFESSFAIELHNRFIPLPVISQCSVAWGCFSLINLLSFFVPDLLIYVSHWSHFTPQASHLVACCLHVECKHPCWVWSVITNSSWEARHWSSHDPTLASRLDPFLCFSLFCFLYSTHSIKPSVLTTLMRVPLTRLSTLSSMPNPVVRFVLWAYSSAAFTSWPS